MARLQPLVGLALIGLIAYSLSTNRRAIRLRTIVWGFGLQLAFALIVLKTAVGQRTLATVKGGSIISLHFNHPGTIAAVPGILDGLRARFARYGRAMAPVNEKQADLIEGAVMLPNPLGSA